MDKLLLKPTEAAEALGVGRSKIYELLASGVVPSVKLGGSLRVPAEALRRWVETQIKNVNRRGINHESQAKPD